jgi:hypothetical protein
VFADDLLGTIQRLLPIQLVHVHLGATWRGGVEPEPTLQLFHLVTGILAVLPSYARLFRLHLGFFLGLVGFILTLFEFLLFRGQLLYGLPDVDPRAGAGDGQSAIRGRVIRIVHMALGVGPLVDVSPCSWRPDNQANQNNNGGEQAPVAGVALQD